jgi:hypothetical protein
MWFIFIIAWTNGGISNEAVSTGRFPTEAACEIGRKQMAAGKYPYWDAIPLKATDCRKS